MPAISTFYGIVIYMYWDDHNPPHFHAHYSGMKALFDIETGAVIRGNFTPRARKLVAEWVAAHREELRDDWHRSQNDQELLPIPPLE